MRAGDNTALVGLPFISENTVHFDCCLHDMPFYMEHSERSQWGWIRSERMKMV